MTNRLLSGTGLAIAAVLFVAVNIISNATLTSFRLDLTENKLYTLSEGTLNILDSLKEPVTLRYYYSARGFSGIPQLQAYGKRVREMLEEYRAHAEGMIDLRIIDPEPFSVAEDQAVAFGIRQVPISAAGEMGYLGLAGTNTTDDEQVIPFFQPDQEDSLEYELTKLVYKLANPRRRVIGVTGYLDPFGGAGNPMTGQPPSDPWTMITMLQELYEVRDLGRNPTEIDSEIDTLVVLHPKWFDDASRYAIDQFVLKGGKALVLVDPWSEEDRTMPDAEAPMVLPDRKSNLPALLEAWGARMQPGKVVGDIDAALRVTMRGARGPQEVEYLPWLSLRAEHMNQQDFVTNQLQRVNLGTAGHLQAVEGARTELTPLFRSGERSMLLDAEGIQFVQDPQGLIENFEASGERYVMAARLRGPARTAFPDGQPLGEQSKRAPQDPDFVRESEGPINVIVVADSDIFADRFWVRRQEFAGMSMPAPIADNADFMTNALDNLGGNDDLISLRSRGESSRPFEVVTELRRQAEARYRESERRLQAKLEETEAKIEQLQSEAAAEGGAVLLSPEQRETIEDFRAEQLRIRHDLREVQHRLQRDIERLGTHLKLINIAAVPLAIGLGAALYTLLGGRRRRPGS